MRSKKNTLKMLLITLMVLVLTSLNAYADANAVAGAHKAAADGLPSLMDASPLLQNSNGSDVLADKSSAFQVFTLDPDALAYNEVREDSIQATPLYCFLVRQGEQVVGLATVEKIKGEWKILTFGGAEMAKEVNQIFETYSSKEGYTTRYLRSYQSFSDYFEIYKNGDLQGVVPLTSGRIAMELENKTFDPKELFDKDQMFVNVGKKVIENLNSWSPSK